CSSQKMSRKELEMMVEQQSQQPVTKSYRMLDACEELATIPCDNLRAAGMAIAKSVNEAKSAAAADARNQLAQMMRVVVKTATQDNVKYKTSNDKKRAQSIGNEMMNQYVYQSIEATKPILWSIYDLSDGTVQAYVCMEMVKKSVEFESDLEVRVAESTPPPVAPSQSIATPAPTRVAPSPTELNPTAEALFEKGRDNCRRFKHDIGIPQIAEAVEMGSINAQYFVGLMYLYGDNVEKDSKLSFQYLLSAANGGHKEAIFQVAEMYNSGTGVEKNKIEARYWYERADELGDMRAESRIRRL
ncbi:MAG: tetratricopeptide repeat protein, partial [Rikenellaceae bacterium]